MGTVRTDEFRKEAVRIALTSGLSRRQVPADNQAERAATIRMRKRHWGRTVGRA